jgi:hypothetical protein
VLETPCGLTVTRTEIIKNLARFVHAESGTPEFGRAQLSANIRTVIICDDADQLDQYQLETIFRLVHGGDRAISAVFLASPDFLQRVQHPDLRRINSATLPCFRFDELQIDEACDDFVSDSNYADDGGKREVDAAASVIDTIPASATPDAMRSRTNLTDRIPAPPSSSASPETPSPADRMEPSMRIVGRHYLAIALCVACVLADLAVVYGGWRFGPSASKGDQDVSRPALPADQASLPDLRMTTPTIAVGTPASTSPPNGVPPPSGAQSTDAKSQVRTSPPASEPSAVSSKPANGAAPQSIRDTSSAAAEPAATGDSAHTEGKAGDSGTSISPQSAQSAPAPSQPRPTVEASALPASAVGTLVARGEQFLGTGDIASARLFFERAANGGDAKAAVRMGETFDAAFLAAAGVHGVQGDESRADFWYRRARELGGDPSSPAPVSEKDKGLD